MKQKSSIQTVGLFVMILALAALACQGPSGFNPFATKTPTPTLTFTPSPTATPSSTPTVTPTQTSSPTPLPSGATSEEQSDGSTLFTDYDNRYQFAIPEAWFVVPLSSGDIDDIINKLAEENPQLKDAAAAFEKLDPDVIRVIAVNKDTKYLYNGFSSNVTVTAVEDKLMSSMPLDFVTGAVEESLKAGGATIIENQTSAANNSNGVELGTLEFQQTAPTVTGTSVPIQSRILMFKSGNKLIMIQLSAPKQFIKELLPALDQIKDTIEVIDL